MQSTQAGEFTTVIQTLEASAKQIRIEADRVGAMKPFQTLDRAAILTSLRSLATRIESYATYLEDCRILAEADEVTPSPF